MGKRWLLGFQSGFAGDVDRFNYSGISRCERGGIIGDHLLELIGKIKKSAIVKWSCVWISPKVLKVSYFIQKRRKNIQKLVDREMVLFSRSFQARIEGKWIDVGRGFFGSFSFDRSDSKRNKSSRSVKKEKTNGRRGKNHLVFVFMNTLSQFNSSHRHFSIIKTTRNSQQTIKRDRKRKRN